MLLKGSLYIIQEDTKKLQNLAKNPSNQNPSHPRKIDTRRYGQLHINRMDNAAPSPLRKSVANSPSRRSVMPFAVGTPTYYENSPIYPQDELMRHFPNHILLNTISAPTYFGEIALNDLLPR